MSEDSVKDFIYCGTCRQTDHTNTQRLLLEQKAIWCPPPSLGPRFQWEETPRKGNRLWLIWRAKRGTPIYLLGGGRVRTGTQMCGGEAALWTNQTLREAARTLGYTVRNDFCFLCLQDPVSLPRNEIRLIEGLQRIVRGLRPARDDQVEILEQILPI